jgi:hypothetical protein
VRVLGIDLELAPVIPMDNRRAVHGDRFFVVKLPRRVQPLVRLVVSSNTAAMELRMVFFYFLAL